MLALNISLPCSSSKIAVVPTAIMINQIVSLYHLHLEAKTCGHLELNPHHWTKARGAVKDLPTVA